jgi:hypothetical protein
VDMRVRCYIGDVLVDSDFMLNWDPQVTRPSTSHMGASLFAHSPTTASYTPQRSYNSGGIVNSGPGVNQAGRSRAGQYWATETMMAAQSSTVWSGAVGGDSKYCKLALWNPYGTGIITYTNCFDSSGNLSDSPYIQTYQGPYIGPE